MLEACITKKIISRLQKKLVKKTNEIIFVPNMNPQWYGKYSINSQDVRYFIPTYNVNVVGHLQHNSLEPLI